MSQLSIVICTVRVERKEEKRKQMCLRTVFLEGPTNTYSKYRRLHQHTSENFARQNLEIPASNSIYQNAIAFSRLRCIVQLKVQAAVPPSNSFLGKAKEVMRSHQPLLVLVYWAQVLRGHIFPRDLFSSHNSHPSWSQIIRMAVLFITVSDLAAWSSSVGGWIWMSAALWTVMRSGR